MPAYDRFEIAQILGNLGDELVPPSPETHEAMLGRMGRNLLLFNQVEGSLKRVIPYIHPQGAALGSTALAQFRADMKRQSLGPTAQRLVESIASTDIDNFALYVKSVVDHRNALAHQFFEQPGVAMSEEGCRIAIEWLDAQYLHCLPLKDYCGSLLVATIAAMDLVAGESE
ncbi:hypothetical protein LYSHEL_00580 [Lysobacter helvus]|uniref:Uncharacterized protein n=2 Tax=Lysobacteraceae TaxID=32033 RepID=A0ABM7Q1G0_9GAMM|nr:MULTISPECIES: hypothetical protein [Lysobacter]BCT91034.1 hypothetical protein LYSCAS_00580 [Lysobacter caseinilyticus]BCT94187.1 hypothetical protein LYSHEL_00580 [Lysobacter helvus]